MKYTLEFVAEAVDDLKSFSKAAQVEILDAIARQLTEQPLQATRNRKPLRPGAKFSWELRIGRYRVFYDVEEETATVSIVAVRHKEHNKLYIQGREVNL